MPEPERRRRRASVRGRLAVGALIGLLGFAATVQIAPGRDEEDLASLRGVELVELLRSVDAANDRLAQQVDELTRTRDELLASRDDPDEARRQAELSADQLAIVTGSVGARGPGVRVRINDPDRQVDAGLLLDVVEELRSAGAEAIVVNGTARVVAQTYFLDDDGGVRVGGREVVAPYVVEAIGDPQTMVEALQFRGGVLERISSRGASASATAVESVSITALADVRSPEYARPDPRQDASAP